MTTIARDTTEHLSTDDPRVVQPIFTLRETAAYLGMPRSTVLSWARPRQRDALITVLPTHGQQATVPFIGFAEAYVLSAFRKAGVPLQRIRPAVEVLSREIGLEHALASHRLYTDGAEVLFDYATDRGDDELLELVVPRTGQHQFSELVKDYLRRVTYGNDGWASALTLPIYERARVTVDPHVAFGLPIVVDGGARVEDLVDRFLAGDTITDVADDFAVPAATVEDIIRVATRSAN